ncbi:MAG: methylenetetrahydrofolate reductase [Candidatus Lokiarchaeota archaeon]|nr:methylenetetrahydrofolate reductase [Candidatus Lokiarchaeota archaeon]
MDYGCTGGRVKEMTEEYYSKLMEKIMKKEFVYTGELEPEKTTDPEETVEAAKEMIGIVTAANVTDGPQAMAYMNSMVASYHVLQAGMEPVYQLTCRDRNRIALVADLLGAYSLGIRNVLALTGDHSGVGDNPDSMPVFDLDSGQLAYLIKELMAGKDLRGNPVHKPPKFWVGVAGNPNADPLEPEILKIGRKAKYADFVQTQVIYQIDETKAFLKELEKYKSYNGVSIPVQIGIFPMKSYGVAKYFNDYIPGVSVPQDLLDEFKAVKKGGFSKQEKKEKNAEINVKFFVPFIKELKKTTRCAGIHVMAVGYAKVVKQIIDEVEGN